MTQLLTFGKCLLHTTELNSTEEKKKWITLGEIPNDLPLICLMDSWASSHFLLSCQSPWVLGYVPRTHLESQIAVTGFRGWSCYGRNNYLEKMVLFLREGNVVVSVALTFQQSKFLLLIWHLKRCYLFGNLFCLRISLLMLKLKLRSP